MHDIGAEVKETLLNFLIVLILLPASICKLLFDFIAGLIVTPLNLIFCLFGFTINPFTLEKKEI